MAVEIQADVIGLVVRVTLTDIDGNPSDLTGADAVYLRLQPPGEDTSEKIATLADDPTTGVITYELQDGDLPNEGPFGGWKVQVVAEYADGSRFRSSVGRIRVRPNI